MLVINGIQLAAAVAIGIWFMSLRGLSPFGGNARNVAPAAVMGCLTVYCTGVFTLRIAGALCMLSGRFWGWALAGALAHFALPCTLTMCLGIDLVPAVFALVALHAPGVREGFNEPAA